MLGKEIVMQYLFLFGGLGMQEMLILLVIVLIIFGGSRLPSLAKGLGESVRNFKRGINEGSEDADEPKEKPRNFKRVVDEEDEFEETRAKSKKAS
jgi:sec-independent protein translocase protein TatA